MVLYIYTAIANKSIRVIYYRYRNIRRRSDVGGSAKKMGMRIKELERLYGVRYGSANEKGNNRIGEPNNSADKKNNPILLLKWANQLTLCKIINNH